MGGVVAIGAASRIEGFALGGASVVCAETPDAVREAWAAVPHDAAVVVLTPEAARALGSLTRDGAGRILVAVMPPVAT